MNLTEIHNRFNDAILAEAVRRFGFVPDSLQELEGSAYVYEGLLGGTPRILKIAPGYWNTIRQVTGSTVEQILAEVDFVHYLASRGLRVALPVASQNGDWVEVIPLDEQTCFLAYCFEKAPGLMFPDDSEVYFPDAVIEEWGRTCGQLHRLSAQFQPNPAHRRLPWCANDLLEFDGLIPSDQTLIYQRRDEIVQAMQSLPQDSESFGLVHGDFHHGNFFVDGETITLFDFDAAETFWYIGEICVALHNCLPLPRSQTAKRRDYALHYLSHFLHGYRKEKPCSTFWVEQIPLFLQHCELLTYAYFYKYWDLSNLSERRTQVLSDLRRRLEQNIPVVAFEPGDLQGL